MHITHSALPWQFCIYLTLAMSWYHWLASAAMMRLMVRHLKAKPTHRMLSACTMDSDTQ